MVHSELWCVLPLAERPKLENRAASGAAGHATSGSSEPRKDLRCRIPVFQIRNKTSLIRKQSMIPLNMHPSFIKNEDKLTEDKKEVSKARYDFCMEREKIMMEKLDEKQKLMITLASENGAAVHGLQHLYLKRMDTS